MITSLTAEIFKAYDIRGIVNHNLDTNIVRLIGQAIATMCSQHNQHPIITGCDGRLSSPSLKQALIEGLLQGGADVIDVGPVTTPMLYFACHHLNIANGVMVTGSHNPANYNGLKIVINQQALYGPQIQQLHQLIIDQQLKTGNGLYQQHDIHHDYQQAILQRVQLKHPLNIALDCGNGIAGDYAPTLFRKLGCQVTELFCEVNGHFPGHHPDPSQPENLKDLQQSVKQLDLGLAFDGDADRLGVVTNSGEIIYPDRQLMLFAADLLQRHPNTEVIFDIKCSQQLFNWIKQHGGRPLIWKTGHSMIKQKMRETGALLAGEITGHLFFKENWYGFDDGLYAGARLLEILSHHPNIAEVFQQLPNWPSTPEILITTKEGEQHQLIKQLQAKHQFTNASEILTLDGVRANFPYGFGLIRASNTTPALSLRFEAKTTSELKEIQQQFKALLQQHAPHLTPPF